jgi:o-succinylbenzoate synthase
MRITNLRWTRYRIPFKRPLVTAHGVFLFREGAIVEITEEGSGITGIGEIAPPPGFGATLEEALAPLPELAASARPDAPWPPGEYAKERWNSLLVPTRFGLDTAVLDYPRPRLRKPTDYWKRVPVNAIVMASDRDEAAQAARSAVGQGFGCVKLKVGICETVDAEVARVAAVRAALGEGVHLRLDANEAWDFEQALAVLKAVAHYGIQYCEQPVPRDDLDGMRRLRQAQPVPIAADEAVTDEASVRRLLDAGAADVLVLKPQCIGGQAECVRLVLHLPKGIKCVWTTSMEAGIGVMATARITIALRSTLESGLATLDLLEDDLIVEPPRIEDGCMIVPYGPGLGVELDRAALARYAV